MLTNLSQHSFSHRLYYFHAHDDIKKITLIMFRLQFILTKLERVEQFLQKEFLAVYLFKKTRALQVTIKIAMKNEDKIEQELR